MNTIGNNILAFGNVAEQGAKKLAKSAGDGAFDALLGSLDATKVDKTKKTSEVVSGSDIANSITQFLANIDLSLLDIGSSSASKKAGSFSADGGISVDALLNQGGPLPEFLDRVVIRYGLSDEKKQALRDITIQFKDTTGSATEIAQMATALKNAGIG